MWTAAARIFFELIRGLILKRVFVNCFDMLSCNIIQLTYFLSLFSFFWGEIVFVAYTVVPPVEFVILYAFFHDNTVYFVAMVTL